MYYTGSTFNLENRLIDHSVWEGSKFTSDKLPVKLVYFEEFERVEDAFKREHQVKKWSRKKKDPYGPIRRFLSDNSSLSRIEPYSKINPNKILFFSR